MMPRRSKSPRQARSNEVAEPPAHPTDELVKGEPAAPHWCGQKRISFALGLLVGVVVLEVSPYSWRPPMPEQAVMWGDQLTAATAELSSQFEAYLPSNDLLSNSSFFQLAWLARSLNPNISLQDLREMLPASQSTPEDNTLRPGEPRDAAALVGRWTVR